MGSIDVSNRIVCSVEGLADSQYVRVKKNTKSYAEGIARNVDVYIDPWFVSRLYRLGISSRVCHFWGVRRVSIIPPLVSYLP